MNILILYPDNKNVITGNLCSALQYQKILQGLGYSVEVDFKYTGQRAEVLIAINAAKKNSEIIEFKARNSNAKIVSVLSGTDIYPDPLEKTIESMKLSNALVALQPDGLLKVPECYREKTFLIYQSVESIINVSNPMNHISEFRVTLIANIRSVKDPLVAPYACKHLPVSSKIKIVHIGYCLEKDLGDILIKENENNKRYNWMGGLNELETRKILSQSNVLLITSKNEGAGRVVGEAIELEIPIISTRNPGVLGVLGDDYKGYYPVSNSKVLSKILMRAEDDVDFLGSLNEQCQSKAHLFSPEVEKQSWSKLISEISLM